VEIISSHSNSKIKQIRALRQRKERQQTGLFLVEGIRPVGEALESGAAVESLCYAPEKLHSDFALNLIEEASAHGVICLCVTAEVFDSLADKENPPGILAVVRQRQTELTALNPLNFPWGVALASPQDSGNVGTILRTIDAVGASGLLLLDSSVDPYHPNAVRASMGSLFWYPIAHATFEEFSGWVSQHGYHVSGTSAHGSQDYREVGAYQRPAILLLGSEREGLNPGQIAVCDRLVRLPMRGRTTSLNLAVAAGVMMYAMMESLEAQRNSISS
jgi:TrmH family RNA methyltransferase